MSMKDLTIEYMMACFMSEMSKHEEKEPQDKDVVMVSRQSKANDTPSS